MGTLFDEEFPVDNSPIEDVRITTTLLYYSEQELKEFKKLCKAGMKKEYGDKATTDGNISDYLLTLLRKENGSTETIPS